MSFPVDLEGRAAKREDLLLCKGHEKARRQFEHFNYSPTCSGQFGYVEHNACVAGAARCLCECHDPKRTEPHDADT